MITIEEIFRRGEISFDTWNICISNQIKTFRDLKRHYIENDSFRDPRIGDRKCNDELIEVLFKYEDLNTDMITTQPEAVTENKSEVKLDDVVTDLDKVIKTNLSAKVSLEVIEKKLKEHWSKKAGNENTQINTAKSSEKATSKKKAVNLRSIEQKLEEYWSKSKEKEGIQNKNVESSITTDTNATNVVDLESIEHALNQYWNKKTTPDTIDIDALEKLEQKLQDYWKKQANDEVTEKDTPDSSV